MADPPTESTPTGAERDGLGLLVEAVVARLRGGAGREGPGDPSHPEYGMGRLGMSELEMKIYTEKDPEVLAEAIRRGMDILDGIPDRLYKGDIPLLMKLMVNPRVGKYRESDYSLHYTIMARLDKLAVDLRIRAEKHKPNYKETEQDWTDMENELRVVVAKELGAEDGVVISADLQARIDDAVYERLQRDVKYKDPLVWQYLRDKQNLIQEEAEKAEVPVETYLDSHPERQDPGETLIRSGLWLEFKARDDIRSAWTDRMGTTGSTDRQRGSSSLFANPGHTDLKAPDWIAAFRDKEMAGREDEVMRAMVDAAEGMEILWINKSHPNDRRSVRTSMWEVMLNMRMKEPAVRRAVMREFPQGAELFEKRAEVKKKLLGGELRREERAAAEKEYARLGTAIGKMADAAKDKPVEKYFKWSNPYLDTFGDAAKFKDWFNYCLDRGGGDMRATFLAWKKFQLWEVISRKGIGSAMHNEKGPGSIDPPVGSDLAAWHYDFMGKRWKEFGRFLNAMGIHVDIRKGSKSRYAAGPPVTLDHIVALGEPFLDHCKVEVPGQLVKQSLWHLWYEMGTALGELPWMKTEDPKDWAGEDQEVSPHSYNGWLYQRFNAEAVRGWLTRWSVSVADLLKMDDEGRLVLQTMIKAFDKTFGAMAYTDEEREKARKDGGVVFELFTVENFENPELRGKIDPRAIAVLGWITQRHPDGIDARRIPGDMERPRPVGELFDFMGVYTVRGETGKLAFESVDLLLDELIAHGFISKESALELLKYCGLSSQTGVSRVNEIESTGGKSGKIEERVGNY